MRSKGYRTLVPGARDETNSGQFHCPWSTNENQWYKLHVSLGPQTSQKDTLSAPGWHTGDSWDSWFDGPLDKRSLVFTEKALGGHRRSPSGSTAMNLHEKRAIKTKLPKFIKSISAWASQGTPVCKGCVQVAKGNTGTVTENRQLGVEMGIPWACGVPISTVWWRISRLGDRAQRFLAGQLPNFCPKNKEELECHFEEACTRGQSQEADTPFRPYASMTSCAKCVSMGSANCGMGLQDPVSISSPSIQWCADYNSEHWTDSCIGTRSLISFCWKRS